MTPDDYEILNRQNDEVLASWWCLLNGYEWPDSLPNPEPTAYIHDGRRSRIMSWIMEQIGHKRISQEWNCVYMPPEFRMSLSEHEDFWLGAFEGDAEAKARHEAYVKRRVEEGLRLA